MASWLQDMYIRLGFCPEAAKFFVTEQGLDSPEGLQVLTDKNVDDICNTMRKPGGKNANGMCGRGQQVSVLVQENLKLAFFLFHHKWRCILEWEMTGVNENRLCLMTGQKKLKDEYKDLDMLPKINKSDMVGMMEAIEEYRRLHHEVIRAPFSYIIRKPKTV